LAPGDSARLARRWRWLLAIVVSLVPALVLDPVRNLILSIDRMSIRSLLKRIRRPLQPEPMWTINRMRMDLTSSANPREHAPRSALALEYVDKPMSRAPDLVESPRPRIRAEHDEKRVIDQRVAARNARRDHGGRRVR
jgi:hypothetical protein